MLKRVINLKRKHFNVLKTLYINFRVFRFKEAVKIPVFLYGKVELEGLHKGCIVLENNKTGVLKFGGGWTTELYGNSNRLKSYLRIKGKLICGTNVIINQGAVLSINTNAIVRIGNNVCASERLIIHSKLSIDIGDNCLIGWNTQIFDSDFHYLLKDGKVYYRNAKVVLGNNVWLANGVSIMKGAFLPAYTVVASNSLVKKNYSDVGERCLLGGIPAKILKYNVERILHRDSQIDKYFKDNNIVICFDDIKEELLNEKHQLQ